MECGKRDRPLEYRNAVRACRDAMRKAKAHLELNLQRMSRTQEKLLQVLQQQMED